MRDIIKALKCTYFAAWSAFWFSWDVGRSENLGGHVVIGLQKCCVGFYFWFIQYLMNQKRT